MSSLFNLKIWKKGSLIIAPPDFYIEVEPEGISDFISAIERLGDAITELAQCMNIEQLSTEKE